MPEPSLHHTGYVVASIAESSERWRNSLFATAVTGPFDDPIQQARVLFLHFAGGETTVELVEPLNPQAPTARFLEKGGGLHHLCFEVDDIQAHIAAMKRQRALLIRQPKPAVAFQERPIAWMLTAEKLLVEYLERPRQQL